MIIIECGYLGELNNLVHIKTILKMQLAGVPIKVNRNIADILMGEHYIYSIMDNEQLFYALTKKGTKAIPVLKRAELTLSEFRLIDPFEYSKNMLDVHITRNQFKVYCPDCYVCGASSFGPPTMIEDINGNIGNYCDNCLKEHGYLKAASLANSSTIKNK